MKFTNGWKASNKQTDKCQLKLRIGSVDVLNIDIDISDKKYSLTILNLKVSFVITQPSEAENSIELTFTSDKLCL